MLTKHILPLTFCLVLLAMTLSACANYPSVTTDTSSTPVSTDSATPGTADVVTPDPASAPFTGEEDEFDDPTSAPAVTPAADETPNPAKDHTVPPTHAPAAEKTPAPAQTTPGAAATPSEPEDVFETPAATPSGVAPVTMPPANVTPEPKATEIPINTSFPFPTSSGGSITLPRIPI